MIVAEHAVSVTKKNAKDTGIEMELEEAKNCDLGELSARHF